MRRELTCIICPRGCSLTAWEEDGTICVAGNACPRGEQYATAECTNPQRTVTAVLRVANRRDTMVSVKTERLVPKGKIFDVMTQLHKLTVNAPIHIGDTVADDLYGSPVVVTKGAT